MCIGMTGSFSRQVFLQLNHHIVAFDLHRIHGQLSSGIVLRLARLRIPTPAVPWADQLIPFDHALPQRSPAVQANVIHSRDSPIHFGNTDHSIATGKFFGFALRRKLGLRSELSEHKRSVERTY